MSDWKAAVGSYALLSVAWTWASVEAGDPWHHGPIAVAGFMAILCFIQMGIDHIRFLEGESR